MINETALQSSIRKAILKEWPGSWIVKIHGDGMQASGIPDLVGCVAGRLIGLEVKKPEGDHPVSSVQEAQLAHIRRAGGLGAVVTSKKEAVDTIREALP